MTPAAAAEMHRKVASIVATVVHSLKRCGIFGSSGRRTLQRLYFFLLNSARLLSTPVTTGALALLISQRAALKTPLPSQRRKRSSL